jgi:hypothetical protein
VVRQAHTAQNQLVKLIHGFSAPFVYGRRYQEPLALAESGCRLTGHQDGLTKCTTIRNNPRIKAHRVRDPFTANVSNLVHIFCPHVFAYSQASAAYTVTGQSAWELYTFGLLTLIALAMRWTLDYRLSPFSSSIQFSSDT